MSEKRFIRNIVGDIYDSEKGKWFEEDWKGKPLDYDDDLIVFLNEQQTTIQEQDKRIKELERMLKKCDAERIRLQNERGAIIKFGVRGGSV